MNTINREEWLTRAVGLLAEQVFAPVGLTLPPVRVSCSWPGGGSANKRIGECWTRASSAGAVNEIFISPRIAEPVAALDILTHELIHAIDDCKSGHKAPFTRLARTVGLEGKPTATHAGKALLAQLEAISAALGAYPHDRLQGAGGRTKQTTRMLKWQCDECNSIWRMAKLYTAQQCPCCGSERVAREG